MSKSLSVIALISGGKDSIYSILHCLENGHRVVALGNLYPQPEGPELLEDGHGEQHDLNSFMYQTVGHTVIPLYAKALSIPLYRQPILGGAVQTGTTYWPSTDGMDETESLVPLLRSIMVAHPEANAVSTGAILSTYQRTRIESVALRLGLEPLSFLWQYPSLPPGTQSSLLEDMAAIGLDARIIKVASGGLDEPFLWLNLTSVPGRRSIERAMARFGIDGDGAVLGEGGEFESLTLNGPDHLFRGKIVVDEEDMDVVREGGGAAWLRVKKARVEMKQGNRSHYRIPVRIPDLLESKFAGTEWSLPGREKPCRSLQPQQLGANTPDMTGKVFSTSIDLRSSPRRGNGQRWMYVARAATSGSIEQEIEDIMEQMASSFKSENIGVLDVISTTIILRSMTDFLSINKIYGKLFSKPNPPSRVTIACGDVLTPGCNIIIQLHISRHQETPSPRRALHVQSRSYWAPANIGPYSQAQSIPICKPSDGDSHHHNQISLVHIAGQIPLVPSTMALPVRANNSPTAASATADPAMQDFRTQALLSLQHLYRIGGAMDVRWWTGCVAYLSRDKQGNISMKACLAGAAWVMQHRRHRTAADSGDVGEEEEKDDENKDGGPPQRDLWEERHHYGLQGRLATTQEKTDLPDWSIIETLTSNDSNDNNSSENNRDILTNYAAPFFAAEIESLPRDSSIEWAAFLGVTGGPINVSCSSSDDARTYTCRIADLVLFRTVMLYYLWPLPHDTGAGADACADGIGDGNDDISMRLATLLLLHHELQENETGYDKGKSNNRSKSRSRRAQSGYFGAETAWLDVSVRQLWESPRGKEMEMEMDGDEEDGTGESQRDWTGVVPCRSLWDERGVRLAAVLVFRWDIDHDR